MSKPHEQLDAWKYAMQLVRMVYQLSADFPSEERYGLAQQMRRAAVSIPSNLAEGAGRNGANELIYFIGIARGSLAELDTQLQIAVMLGFLNQEHPAFAISDRVGKLLTGLHKKWSAA
ncbi:MAG: four helix bundle protein [Gallionella sp.]